MASRRGKRSTGTSPGAARRRKLRGSRGGPSAPERAGELAALRAMCAAGSRNPAGAPTAGTQRGRRRAALTAFVLEGRRSARSAASPPPSSGHIVPTDGSGRARVMARVGYPSPERSSAAKMGSRPGAHGCRRSRHRCCCGERIDDLATDA